MTADTKFKLAFLLLLAGLLALFCRNVLAAGEIKISVEPQVAVTNPYQAKMFRVRVTIPRHKDNRLWSYTASCGEEIKSSDHEIDVNSQITYTWFEELTVTENCIFQACLHRKVRDKIQNYCDYQEVTTDSFDPF